MSTSWHISIAYNGTRYHGFQVQPSVPTIQGEIEERLQNLFRSPDLRISATSRTDAGVHALDQHISFKTAPAALTPSRLVNVLNGWLPADIRVKWARNTSTEFHARSQAAAKSYLYAVHPGNNINPFLPPYTWKLDFMPDISRMRQAAEVLSGRHNFASFAVNSRKPVFSYERTMHRIEIFEDKHSDQFFIHVLGEGFLYKMVRSIAGYIVSAGKRPEWTPQEAEDVLSARDRCAAGLTAPAHALFLTKVFFDDVSWQYFKPPVPPLKTAMPV